MLENARKDYLTSLYARDSLDAFIEKAIADSEKEGKKFCVVLLDLDHFKKLNDKFGHLFGDDVLKFSASVLQMTFYNNEGIFFRYGGDEFIGVFCNAGSQAVTRYMKLFFYNVTKRPFLFKNKFYKIALSCGISCFPHDGKSLAALMAAADKAMYYSKRCGHNVITQAGRIRFLKTRRALVVVFLSLLIISGLVFLYHWTLKSIIRPQMEQFKSMKIVSKPQDLDTIVLKDGAVFEGRILSESSRRVVVDLYFKKGEGKMVFRRSEIADIRHGQKSL
ncbi:MAG: GGDEF domain-containing protein [Candidatus Omnitrophota bacterium]